MQKITPNLWFDTQAEEAAAFYVSLFEQGKVGAITRYDEAMAEVSGLPAGSALTVAFELDGMQFVALNGGPQFQFTPAVSFFVDCATEAEVDQLYEKLSTGGQVLMPLQAYPFSEKFAWIQDKYGLSWQLNLSAPRDWKISPFLMFVGPQCGKAEEAIELYTSLFDQGRIESLTRYEQQDSPEIEGTVKQALFWLEGQKFMALDSNLGHAFSFTEAISFIVDCESQEEVDYFWEQLTAGGEEQPCGWLKDRFGVSWQIVPRQLMDMISHEDQEKAAKAVQAMLSMKKIDIAQLEQAFNS